MTRPIHAVPLLLASDHHALPTCPCRPTPDLRDLETGALIYIHHEPASERLERLVKATREVYRP